MISRSQNKPPSPRKPRSAPSSMVRRIKSKSQARRTGGILTVRNSNVPAAAPASPKSRVKASSTAPKAVRKAEPKQPPKPEPTRIRLPRTLPRPVLPTVSPAAIESAYPDLRGITAAYIRESLPIAGSQMLAAAANLKARPMTSALPRELEIVMNDIVATSCPTHMFAIHGPAPGPSASQPKRKVTLFAAHHIVFAANCANMPVLHLAPPVFSYSGSGSESDSDSGLESESESSSASSRAELTMKIPVVPLCVPSPETFPLLQAYLYTKQPQHLLSGLRPPLTAPECVSPSETVSPTASPPMDPTALAVLMKQAMLVHGIWRNACALGVVDDVFWSTVEKVWEGIMEKLERGVGLERVVPPVRS